MAQNPAITKICAGDKHTLFVDDVKQGYGVGSNRSGQLVSNVNQNFSSPRLLQAIQDIEQIAASSEASHFIRNNGALHGFGDNTSYGVGHRKSTQNTGRIHGNGSHTSSVSSAASHVVETCNGAVKYSGENTHGQLGRKKDKVYKGLQRKAKELLHLTFKSAATGKYHTLLITEVGELYTSGENKDLQLGFTSIRNSGMETACFGFELVPFPGKIVKAVAGKYHSVILFENGDAWSAGNNQFGQLGRTTNSESGNLFQKIECGDVKFTDIAAGDNHTLLLSTEKHLWIAGSNKEGQLGLLDKPEQLVLEMIDLGMPITGIAAGCSTSFVISEGIVWATGQNDCGQLGLGDLINRTTFTQLPQFTKNPPPSTRRDTKIKPADQKSNPPSSQSQSGNLPIQSGLTSADNAIQQPQQQQQQQQPQQQQQQPQQQQQQQQQHQQQQQEQQPQQQHQPQQQQQQQQQQLQPQQAQAAHRLRGCSNPNSNRLSGSSDIAHFPSEPLSEIKIRQLCDLVMPGGESEVKQIIIVQKNTRRLPSAKIHSCIKTLFFQHRLQMICWCDLVRHISFKIARLSRPGETQYEQIQEGLEKLCTLVIPIAHVEDEIKSCFAAKLSDIKRLNMNDMQVLLCISRLTGLADSFKRLKIDGEMLSMFVNGTSDHSAYMDEAWNAKNCCRFQNVLDQLRDGVFLDRDHETECPGCSVSLKNLLSDLPQLNHPCFAHISMKEFLGMKNDHNICAIYKIHLHRDKELIKLINKIREQQLNLHSRYMELRNGNDRPRRRARR